MKAEQDRPVKIAAMTMVRNDDFFLRRWVEYYSAQLGAGHLYVWFDGEDQTIPDFCKGINASLNPRLAGNVARGDRLRAGFLSSQARRLMTEQGYDMVIGTDVDEFLVVDPALGLSLTDYLSSCLDLCRSRGWKSVSGLGVDVGQDLRSEGKLDEARPFLEQRGRALLSTRYSKSTVLAAPVEWGSGFHRTRHHNFHIVKDLYLFHFGCVDLARIEAKFEDRERVAEGWTRHFKKRIRTITVISASRVRPWEKCVPFARRVQNTVRPLQAWNKPAMFNLKLVVEIPQRFRSLL